jgi:hypothetical protein
MCFCHAMLPCYRQLDQASIGWNLWKQPKWTSYNFIFQLFYTVVESAILLLWLLLVVKWTVTWVEASNRRYQQSQGEKKISWGRNVWLVCPVFSGLIFLTYSLRGHLSANIKIHFYSTMCQALF